MTPARRQLFALAGMTATGAWAGSSKGLLGALAMLALGLTLVAWDGRRHRWSDVEQGMADEWRHMHDEEDE